MQRNTEFEPFRDTFRVGFEATKERKKERKKAAKGNRTVSAKLPTSNK